MTRKEQNKILDAKIESNVNQYKVDRLNAEISAFSSGDLNKYEFLKRIDLNYKPNALDKARFEFSPLGQTCNTRLDKNAQGYQEEGIIKLLKDIRDGLAGGITPRAPKYQGHQEYQGDQMMMMMMMMDLMTMIMDLIQRHMILHIHQMMMIIKKYIIIYCLNIFN